MTRSIIATVAGGLILTMLHASVGIALGPMPIDEPPNVLTWLLVSNTIISALLVWFARGSAWSGLRLTAALFVVSYGIGQLNSLIEAYFFDFFKRPGEFRRILAHTLLVYVMFAPAIVLLADRWRGAGSAAAALPKRTAANWVARIAACGAVYLLCYFIAGIMVLPYVRHFYAELPDPTRVFLLQLLVRGPLFALFGLIIVNMVPGTRRAHALMVGLALSLLGGFAPLLAPNPYFPDDVRWAHFVEVVSSNFVFGGFVGWLLGGSRQESKARVLTSAA